MTWQFTPNIVGTSTTDSTGLIIRALLDLMVASGTHSIVGAGDGRTNFENEGDTAGPYDILSVFTSYPATADFSFSNPFAWFRFRETGTTREWVFSRYSVGGAGFADYMSVSFSPTGYVSTGTATGAVPPTAPADVVWLWGTGYGALAGGNWGPNAASNLHMHVAVQDTAVAGVYPFYCFSRLSAGGGASSSWLWDAISDGIIGDAQPWISVMPTTMGSGMTLAQMNGTIKAYSGYGGASESLVGCAAMCVQDSSNGSRLFPGSAGPQTDGFARQIPIPIGSYLAGFYKGVSASMRWKGTSARGYPDTNNLTLTTAQVYVDDILLPWAQNVVPL